MKFKIFKLFVTIYLIFMWQSPAVIHFLFYNLISLFLVGSNNFFIKFLLLNEKDALLHTFKGLNEKIYPLTKYQLHINCKITYLVLRSRCSTRLKLTRKMSLSSVEISDHISCDKPIRPELSVCPTMQFVIRPCRQIKKINDHTIYVLSTSKGMNVLKYFS